MLRGLRIIFVLLLSLAWTTAIANSQAIPTGLYGFWSWGNFDEILQLISESKFDIVVGPNTKPLLDKAHQEGLKAIVSFSLMAEVANDDVRWSKYKTDLGNLVDSLKSHPAVFAWYPVDEPDWQKIPISKIKEIRRIITSRDTVHPIFTVLQSPRTWTPYLSYFDIVSVDPYLMQQPSGARDNPEKVRNYLRAIKKDLRKLKLNKPVWVVLGAFEEKPVLRSGAAYFCSPTSAEFKTMVDLALAEKVDGLLVFALSLKGQPIFYDWNLPRDNPALWETVKEVVPGAQK